MRIWMLKMEYQNEDEFNMTRAYTNYNAAREQLQWEVDNSEADRIDWAYDNKPSSVHGLASALVHCHYHEREEMVEMQIYSRKLLEDAELGG